MKKSSVFIFALLLNSTVAFLAAQPDAGTLLREQQSDKERLPPKPLPQREEPPTPETATAKNGPTLLLKEIRFRGYEGLATEPELQQIVKSSVGTNVGVGDLQRLADEVSAALRAKGHFLARAYLPKQDITGGVVEIAIIQARSDGGVTINRAVEVRMHQDKLQAMVDNVIKADQALSEFDLERVLLLMNDLPGVAARATLEPGSAPGTTHITANVTEADLFSGTLWADNSGNRFTGAIRGNGLLSLSDPFRFGDEANLLISGSDGLIQGRLFYGAPIGSSGLRGDVSVSDMQYKIVEGASTLGAKGSAQTASVGALYPLIRRRLFRLTANAGYQYAGLVDKAFGSKIRDRVLHSGTAGVSGDRSDNFYGGGMTSFTASITGGNLDLSKLQADETADRGGPKTSGSYARFNLSLSRLQHITDQLTFSAAYSDQLATKNLDSSEKFSLGGPYAVRAYPVGEATGDEGHLFNFEARQTVPVGLKTGSFHVIGFVDAGNITLNKNPWAGGVTNITNRNSYWLYGAGVGVELSRPDRYTLRLSYAHAMGDNPGRSPTGMNADGRSDSGRVWAMFQVTL